jgi:hypothetical protein
VRDYVVANRKAYDALVGEYLARVGHSAEPLDILAGSPLRYARKHFANIRALEVVPGNGEVCAYCNSNGCDTTAIDVALKILQNVYRISPQTTTVKADIFGYNLG